MKTTLELPDDLLREAETKAAREGIAMNDFFSEALQLRLAQSPSGKKKRFQFPILRSSSKTTLDIPDDIASRLEIAEDLERYEASLR